MAIPTPITPRLTSAYISQPLSYRFPLEGRQEPLEPGLVWDEIRLFADVREKGEKIFTGTRSEQRARWQALNDFARQARSYSDALEVTRGTSRGLLGYYSALNLAKAELLHSNPGAVINKRINHGLSFDVGRNTTIRSDSIRVAPGVFPLLYEARTGMKMRDKTVLPVKRLLSQLPEIGHEYERVFSEPPSVSLGWYRTVGHGSEYWPLLIFTNGLDVLSRAFEWHSLMRMFDPVEIPTNWRFSFPEISPRMYPQAMLQGKTTFQSTSVNKAPHMECVEYTRSALGSAIDAPMQGNCDLLLCPSLYKSRRFAMPSFLARYALMFYLSSLIRYRPSRLNPDREQLTLWLLEAFARQSPNLLLANGLEGVIQKSLIFNI
jgi:hypothetical protein